jgi:hypothetical protein
MDPTKIDVVVAHVEQGMSPLAVLMYDHPPAVVMVTDDADVRYAKAEKAHIDTQAALREGNSDGDPLALIDRAKADEQNLRLAKGIITVKQEFDRLSRGFVAVATAAGAVTLAATTFWIASAISADNISATASQHLSTEQLAGVVDRDHKKDYIATSLLGTVGVGMGWVGADTAMPYYVRKRARATYRRQQSRRQDR